MIRAIFDPNVFISYLLAHNPNATVARIVAAAGRERFRLLVSPSLLIETVAVTVTKPKLTSRISRVELGWLVQFLLSACELIPELDFTPPPISRDPKDDYLLAHAVLEGVDYLVTGDRDLLALAAISPVKIVSPSEFARILDDIPDGEG